ncbi:MAG: hypothetical protein ACLR9U_04640 [Lachnospira sp.]
MLHTITNVVVFVAIVMWSIIIITFIAITLYNKATGKAIKKSGKATTQDLTVQSKNIDYEEIRKTDVENIVNSESSNNQKNNKPKSTLIL